MTKFEQNGTELTSELLRKKTSEAISELTKAISGIQSLSEEVMDSKDSVIRQEVKTSIEVVQESIRLLSAKVDGIKEGITKELLESIKKDIAELNEQTKSAIEEMKTVKDKLEGFQAEIAKQMENEKARVSKFFKGVLDLVSQA